MLFPHSTENYTLPFLIEWGPVKNIPADENLINSQQITRLSTGTAELEGFSSVFQLQFLKEQSQLTNAQIVASNQLAFTID